jgi:hypothetical protein
MHHHACADGDEVIQCFVDMPDGDRQGDKGKASA